MVISSTVDNVEYFGKFLALREMTQVALTNEKLAKYVLNMTLCVLLENVKNVQGVGISTKADAAGAMSYIIVLKLAKNEVVTSRRNDEAVNSIL